MIRDFMAFVRRGNVLDLAVGVIVGGAFGKIVSSLVDDVIMPLLGKVIGGVDFSSLKWVLTPAVMDGDVVVSAENALLYGSFIQNVVNFFVIALCVFVFIRTINRMGSLRKKREEQEQAPSEQAPPASEALLTEIRDILRERGA